MSGATGTGLLLHLYTCDICGESVSGSHYHCACGAKDVTSSYGHHHGGSCSYTAPIKPGEPWRLDKNISFHHCGPDGDCDLLKAEAAA